MESIGRIEKHCFEFHSDDVRLHGSCHVIRLQYFFIIIVITDNRLSTPKTGETRLCHQACLCFTPHQNVVLRRRVVCVRYYTRFIIIILQAECDGREVYSELPRKRVYADVLHSNILNIG